MPVTRRTTHKSHLKKIQKVLVWGDKRAKRDRELSLDLGELRDVNARLNGLIKLRNKRKLNLLEKELLHDLKHRARIILRNIAPKMD